MRIIATKEEWIGFKTAKTITEQQILKLIAPAVEAKAKELIQSGLPDDWCDRLQEFGEVLCERADVMLYPDKKTIAEAQQIFDRLVESIAILSFVKGGIHIFGHHFEVVHDGSGKA